MAPWTIARQASLSTEFSRQEYLSGVPFPPPRYLPNPGIEPAPPASPALAGGFFTTELETPFHGFVANFYRLKRKIPAGRVVLGDWLRLYRVSSWVGIFT